MLCIGDLAGSLLRAAVDVEGPRRVAEVALQLADDGGHCERAERESALGIEALDGLYQPEACNLDEVLVGLA